MKRFYLIILPLFGLGLFLMACCPFANKAKDTKKAQELGAAVMDEVVPGMVKTLFAQLDSVGAEESIPYCQTFAPAYGKEKHQLLNAPAFTEKFSVRSIAFKRTSLKVRNPANQPTAKESEVLQAWQKQFAGGEKPQPVVFQEGDEYVSMMPMLIPSPRCLTCHGEAETLDAKVKNKLQELYPQDTALGYKDGDLRGAFVVKSKF